MSCKTIARVPAFLAALLFCCPTMAAEIIGRVVAVQSGDTITVLDANRTRFKVRLLGVDAPESGQAFGVRSKEHLSGLVHQQEVRVEYVKRDRYRHILGKVFAAAPCLATPCPLARDANLEQIRAGMAWWYRPYSKNQSAEDRDAYELAEAEARDAGRGLWAARVPVAPWEWRRVTGGRRM